MTMPRLSLYRPNRTSDYQYIDRVVSEMYTVGGVDIYVHKYLGPEPGRAEGQDPDATQPSYDDLSALNIEDLLLLENRDRIYDEDIYVMRGVYRTQEVDFDLSQFGLFLNNDTLFLTFHFNDMIDTFGRKLMSGDVLEVPNLKDFYPLNEDKMPLPKFYVIQDAAFASEGFSVTWLPHLWRVKCTPLVNAQEYKSILDKPLQTVNIHDPDNFYPPGSIVQQGDQWYISLQNTPAGIDITNANYWSPYEPPSIADNGSTRPKDESINDAILNQADVEVPLSGYDNTSFYVEPTTLDGQPANPFPGITADGTPTVDGTQGGMDVTARAFGFAAGYLTGSTLPPNGLPATSGVTFPSNPVDGDYCLRLDYFPNRLFRYNQATSRWIKIESDVRTDLNNAPTNNTLRSGFVNNTYTVRTTDLGNIPSRQSLSELLRPQADNGDQGGNKPANPRPATQPGQPND